MYKLITGLALAAALAGPATASQVYYDDGVDNGGGASTSTGLLDSLSFIYNSVSTVTDEDGTGNLTAGDTIVSSGGTALFGTDLDAISASNAITNFNPFGADSDGYGFGNWVFTFGFDNLMGTFDGEFFNYSSGDVTLIAYDFGTDTSVEILTMSITSSVSGIPNTVYKGNVTVTNDYFYAQGESFQTILDDGRGVYFEISQNSNPSLSGQALVDALGDFGDSTQLGGQHSGTLRFNVPEPSSLAVMGLGLLGLAGFSRRRKA